MGKRYCLPIVIAALIFTCGAPKNYYPHAVHPTTAQLDSSVLQDVLGRVEVPEHIRTQSAPAELYPVAGTVSHHLLVAPLINNWFTELKRLRAVETFIILSPRHFPQGNEQVSFSTLPWDAGNGKVEPDTECIDFLKNAVGLPPDPEAMHMEHGVGALLPYIVKYFPHARIVPVVIDELCAGPGPVNRLAAALYNLLQDRKDIFLIISTDFSHHAAEALTGQRDERTADFLAAPALERLPLVYSDNNKGLRVLAFLYENMNLNIGIELCHTNSFEYSGDGEEDITSYFFYFWGRMVDE
ncbi:MAG: AmmeMemoRadiSam system protein B [Spirochaetales bacterium]|nr:AmmeMemoRadiSam system protein B [Spirochaetales bacterium]